MKLDDAKILIADDSILVHKQLKDVINMIGSPMIVEAKNGQEAIDQYKEHKPDLVFLDIVMPIKDGIAAIKEIMEFDPKARIVVVSSVGTKEQLKEAILSGASDFLQKPLYAPQIVQYLRHIFEGR